MKNQNDDTSRLETLQKNADILMFLHLQGQDRALELLCDMHELRAKIIFGFLLHVAINLNEETCLSSLGGNSESQNISLFLFAQRVVHNIAKNPPERFKKLIPQTIL